MNVPTKITNLSSKKTIKRRLTIADSTAMRMRGLMFRKKCMPMLFVFDSEAIWPIHSFFVGFPFDAIFLSGKNRVVGVFPSIKPFTPCVSPPQPSKYLLELPDGDAKKLKAGLGDTIRWA